VETTAYIVPSIFAANRSTANQEGGSARPLETRSYPTRSQINIFGFKYGNPNSDVWKFIRADNLDKPWIREYSNILRIIRPNHPRSWYKVISGLTVLARVTCDKSKIVPPFYAEWNWISTLAARTISGLWEFYPTTLTSSNNFLLKRQRQPASSNHSF